MVVDMVPWYSAMLVWYVILGYHGKVQDWYFLVWLATVHKITSFFLSQRRCFFPLCSTFHIFGFKWDVELNLTCFCSKCLIIIILPLPTSPLLLLLLIIIIMLP